MEVKELQTEFLKLKFGMFISYNMATYQGAQWVKGYCNPSDFNPGGTIDTDAWADAAKAAGMTYGVLTAKHVGGFCLWDSAHTQYSVMHPDCPYQQDLVQQFVSSFTSRGLKVGIYYCWRHPGFDEKKKGVFKVLPPECDPSTHSMAEQIEYQKKQIQELVNMFPDVFYIWNDALDPDVMEAGEAAEFMRSLGPDIIGSGNWWDWGRKGEPYLDLAVTEKKPFTEGNTTPGESCSTLEDMWFWFEGTKTKDTESVIERLKTANSRNANLLLNVGPDRNGRIMDSSIDVLRDIGEM
jgi:alpha-L-fucosidase